MANSRDDLSACTPDRLHVSVRILDVAESLFAKLGYQGTTLKAIARAVGTSESGVLRFYPTKHDVFLTVLGRASEELAASIDDAVHKLSPAADSLSQLMEIAQAILHLYSIKPDKVALVFSECGLSLAMLQGPEGRTLMALPGMVRLVDQFTEPFTSGIARGELLRIDPIAGREVFFGVIEGTILGWLLSSDRASGYASASPSAVLEVLGHMLSGLKAKQYNATP